MNKEYINSYTSFYNDILKRLATLLEIYIRDILLDVERIDTISARAKSPDRFIAKANKLDESGNIKYPNPLDDIQDIIGARVNVLYLSDVPRVKSVIEEYFTFIEKQIKSPERDEEFGYFGEHYILQFPDDAIPDGLEDKAPKFFELQIKTLFQHAWSEAHHDLGYKSPRKLSAHERRQMAFSAAQSWGADQIFLQLSNLLLPHPQNDDDIG